MLLAEASDYLEHEFNAIPGSVGIVVRHSRNAIDDTGVFVHWLTKPGDLVRQQDLAALEAACIHGVRCELDELAFFAPVLAVQVKH
ncbi:hypothetical protein ACWEFD_31755 [Streptomyces ardesiacus]